MSRHTKKHRFQTVIALDSQYMPMGSIPRRKALKALATGRALALDLSTWAKLGIQEVSARPFQVVVFTKAKAVSEVKLGSGRGFAGVFKRDNHRCQYCNGRGTTLDHVIPRCQGGQSVYMNLVAACQPCNTRKGGRTPEQAGMPLRSPIKSPRAVLMERFQALVDGAA
jgi:hypothetical protein